MTGTALLHCGDASKVLARLKDGSARTCVTSPPYWGLRDYGVRGQLGKERTPDLYVKHLVDMLSGLQRVLTQDGTLWLNLGDSYIGGGRGGNPVDSPFTKQRRNRGSLSVGPTAIVTGMKEKDLAGIPWLVALALRDAGWYLRSSIIWEKPNCMPDSTRDRPTNSHEHVFLLSRSRRYYYDADAIAEPLASSTVVRFTQDVESQQGSSRANGGTRADRPMKAVRRKELPETQARLAAFRDAQRERKRSGNLRRGIPSEDTKGTRNARSVWTIPTQSYKGSHFATFPEELARRCILAGSAPGDTVLDPFGGSGTVAAVALGLGRSAIHIDLNPTYIGLARERIGPLLCRDVAA